MYPMFSGAGDGHVRRARAPAGKTWRRLVGGIDWRRVNPAVVVEPTRRFEPAVWHAGAEDPEVIDALNAALAAD